MQDVEADQGPVEMAFEPGFDLREEVSFLHGACRRLGALHPVAGGRESLSG